MFIIFIVSYINKQCCIVVKQCENSKATEEKPEETLFEFNMGSYGKQICNTCVAG